MRILSRLERITDVVAATGMWAVPPLVCVMAFEVFSRYVFAAPTIWAFELSYMLMGAVFMAGMASALKTRNHVSVDLIYSMLSAKKRAVIDILGYCLLLPLVCWLVYGLFDYTLTAFISGEVTGKSAWNPKVWPFRSILFLGFVVFALQIIIEFVRAISVLIGYNNTGTDK